jgi:hypothetical protein
METGAFIQPGLQQHGHIAVKGIEFVGPVECYMGNTVFNSKKNGRHDRYV